jgi:hypothetical protein
MTVTAVPPLALSLSDTFTKVGAVVAFATFLGIALLAMLFFAQARELKRLREWSEEEPARMAELQQRLNSAMAMRIERATAAPARPVAPVRSGVAAVAVSAAGPATQVAQEAVPADAPPVFAFLPAAPAVIAGNIESEPQVEEARDDVAPALASALPVAAVVRAEAAAPEGEEAVPAAAAAAPEVQVQAPELAAVGAAVPAAAAAAPAAPSAPRAPTPPPRPTRPVPRRKGEGQFPPNPLSNGRSQPSGRPVRRRGGPPPGPPFLREEPSVGRGRLLLVGGAVLVVVVLIAVFALGIGRGSSSPNTATSSGTSTSTNGATAHHGEVQLPAATPAETHVVVFNGTETEGLAHHLASDLQQSGYTLAAAQSGNPPGGTYSTTVVEYASGHQADAQHVSQTLGGTPVHKLDPALAAMANGATVVVVAGSNASSGTSGSGTSSNGSSGTSGASAETSGSAGGSPSAEGTGGEAAAGTGEAAGGTGQ